MLKSQTILFLRYKTFHRQHRSLTLRPSIENATTGPAYKLKKLQKVSKARRFLYPHHRKSPGVNAKQGNFALRANPVKWPRSFADKNLGCRGQIGFLFSSAEFHLKSGSSGSTFYDYVYAVIGLIYLISDQNSKLRDAFKLHFSYLDTNKGKRCWLSKIQNYRFVAFLDFLFTLQCWDENHVHSKPATLLSASANSPQAHLAQS